MIIKSPRYTGGDFMFLYRFVRRRRRTNRYIDQLLEIIYKTQAPLTYRD